MDEDDVIDLIQDCQSKISKTLFNKNNKKSFWSLLEKIMMSIVQKPNATIHDIADSIDTSLKASVFTLDDVAILYFIALVKDGMKNENS